MPQRDGAAVDVHPAPVPPELLTVGERLGRERLVRLDEVVVADRGARLPHEIADGGDRGEEGIFGGGGGRGFGGGGGVWRGRGWGRGSAGRAPLRTPRSRPRSQRRRHSGSMRFPP